MPDWLDALLLGVVEGLTEFIPVSSTAHLLLAGRLLGFESPAFTVAIQLGAMLAIVWLYLGKLWRTFADAPHDPQARRFIVSVLLAFLPAALLGFLLRDLIEGVLFESLGLISAMLVLGGLVLLVVDRAAPPPRVHQADGLPFRTALGIGLFQCVALVPGVSRSGATIVGALLLGVERRAAAEFSFFLGLPTMAGAVALDLLANRAALTGGGVGLIAIGFAAALVTGVAVVRWLLAYVQRHGFRLFGWWRIAVGAAGLLWLGLGG